MTTALASNANASTLNGVRSLAVIDIENLLGDDPRVATSAGIRATIAAFIERADLQDDDLIAIACNPALALLVHDAGLLRHQAQRARAVPAVVLRQRHLGAHAVHHQRRHLAAVVA